MGYFSFSLSKTEKLFYLKLQGTGLLFIRMTNRKIRSGLQGCLLIIVAFSFAFNPYHSSAQQKIEPPFKRCPVNTINYDQGLMNNSINGIITDMQGFTWISTSAGIQRYNGYSLQTITPVADGDTIRINYPVCFLEAKNHSILIGYANGILSYDPGNNSFKKLVKRVAHPNTRSALMPLKETDEGLWCFEENKGIVVYNNKNVAFSQVPSTENANVTDLIRTEDYNK
jgi:ligand-binding sensor domain-containing protein